MKFIGKYLLFLCCVSMVFFACKKSSSTSSSNGSGTGSGGGVTNPTVPTFITYTIKSGQQFSDLNLFAQVSYTEQKFIVKFDSSVIYTTKDPANQFDINKLYGFSDNDSLHHVYSARFGWNWQNNAIWLYAYVYNNTTLLKQTLTTIPLGQEAYCSIKVSGTSYIFTVNGNNTTIPRLAKTTTGSGYKLYPYFGGNETAPHDIRITIKEY